ncbi:MAG: Crp/Fnr family transcriptional regulator [Hyphomicrobium sp.]
MLLADKGQFAVAHPAQLRADQNTGGLEGKRRMIAHGESLFSPGTSRRSAYRVESGALCHYVVWPDGTHDVIEFAFPGDIVGLGSLGEHVSTAQAMVDTSVAIISDEELDRALAADAALASRMASATDREFDFLRRRALQPGLRPVINRLAAFILAVGGAACRSGDTHLDVGNQGIAALSSQLEVPAVEIESALATLKACKSVSVRDETVIILDRDALEALADA